jgi:hypothetical protein
MHKVKLTPSSINTKTFFIDDSTDIVGKFLLSFPTLRIDKNKFKNLKDINSIYTLEIKNSLVDIFKLDKEMGILLLIEGVNDGTIKIIEP